MTDEQYNEALIACEDWRYLVVLAGGMATRSALDVWLQNRYEIDNGIARSINNDSTQTLPPFQIENGRVTWTAQRPEPTYEQYGLTADDLAHIGQRRHPK